MLAIKLSFERLLFSARLLVYLGALILALGAARATTGIISTMLIPEINFEIKPPSAPNKKLNLRSKNIELAKIIPGVFFMTPVFQENKTMPEQQAIIHFTLVATLEGSEKFSRAVIKVAGKAQDKEYAIGQKIGAAKLKKIKNGFIIFRIFGKDYKLFNSQSTHNILADVNSTAKKIIQGSTKPQAPPPPLTRVISRERIRSVLKGGLPDLYKGASFGPELVAGKIKGYRMRKIHQSHLFYQLGARSGDLVKSINGFALGDIERMFELYRALPTAPRIKVEIVRNGQTLLYDFHIRN